MNKVMTHPYIPIAIGVIAVSLSAIFVRLANADAGITAFYRMLFSVFFMLPIFLIKYKFELKKLTRRDWLLSIFAGILLSFHFIFWFESLNYTSIASSTVLVTLQPFFSFIGTYIFFKERLTLKSLLSGCIAIIGSVFISWGDFRLNGLAFWGDLLALIACIFVTAYLLLGQDVRKRLSLVTYTIIVYSFSTITLLFYSFIKGEKFGPYPEETWLWFTLLAIVPNLLGHTLFNWSIKYVSTNVISIAILFEPIGASFIALFLFNEYLTASQMFGGSLIIVGIMLFVLEKKYIKKFLEKTLESLINILYIITCP